MSFTGKKVLITGGAGCLGLETAKRFYSEGATVFILDKDSAGLEKAKLLLPNATTIVVDLLDWEATRSSVSSIGHIDHLVNNAGIQIRQSFMDIQPEAIDQIFGINFKAIVNVSQVVAAGMMASGKPGTIVNISSIAGKIYLPRSVIYSSFKAALNMLTRSMAAELGQHNIRVNALCPTCMVTNLSKENIEKCPQFYDAVLKRAAIGRFLELSETVDSIIFLSSANSTMINGTSIDIDGGYVAAS